jgi:hypothetical protein
MHHAPLIICLIAIAAGAYFTYRAHRLRKQLDDSREASQ